VTAALTSKSLNNFYFSINFLEVFLISVRLSLTPPVGRLRHACADWLILPVNFCMFTCVLCYLYVLLNVLSL
jgi:hypothetical protein